MKKKSERFSVKKLTPTHRRHQTNNRFQDLYQLQEKFKSHVKNNSSEKYEKGENNVYVSQKNHKFKIYKPSSSDKARIKTQADEQVTMKAPYQKYMSIKKKEAQTKNKTFQDKNKKKQKSWIGTQYHIDTKHKHKRLIINTQTSKDNSLEKFQAPLTSKNHHSFRKQQQSSYRCGTKRTALQRYISDSLQSLTHAKKKKILTKETYLQDSNRNREDSSTLIKEKKKQLKQIKVFDDVTQGMKQQKILKQSKQKLKTQKDESIEKIELQFKKRKRNAFDLTKQQEETFGDRFPDGFNKLKLLGRGGFSLVWLGEHKKSKKKYAVKQIITESSHQTHIKQIWFGTYFFEFGGAPKQQFASHPGVKNLVKLYYYFINKKDTWILYEKCGDSLGNCLYDLKGEYVGGEKLYRIYYKPLYSRIRKNQQQLRKIIFQVATALELLAQNNIVHSDLKTENILIKMKRQQQGEEQSENDISEVKLIDYGSSFVFNNLRQFSMATPQYMAPEILNFILYENQLQYVPKLFQYVEKYTKPWVIDVWSLGCVVLQIISGIPLWMSLKTIVRKKSSQLIKYGLFAIKGRLFDKIIRRQIEVVQNLDHYLYEQNYSGIVIEQDIKVLLKRMLSLNPDKRISPKEIVQYLNLKAEE